MTEYQLQILRNEAALPSRDAAILLLNSYEHHRIGQPVAVLYRDGEDVCVLYAIGKKDASSVTGNAKKSGADFYDIIGPSDLTPLEWEDPDGGTSGQDEITIPMIVPTTTNFAEGEKYTIRAAIERVANLFAGYWDYINTNFRATDAEAEAYFNS